jgi:hypothetical protein
MRKTVIILIVLTWALMLASCANLTVTRNDSPPTGGEALDFQMAYLAWGILPIRQLPPASQLCPKGRIESVAFGRTSQDAILTWLTLGLYVPHRATIICSPSL